MLNSLAMLIFGTTKSVLSLNRLSKYTNNPEAFIEFIGNIGLSTSQFTFSLGEESDLKTYFISGIKFENSLDIHLSIQIAGTEQGNAEYLCQYASFSDDVFALWNTENKLLYLNHNFEKLFGRERKELNDNPFTVFSWMHPDDRLLLEKKTISDEYINAENLDVEFRLLMPDSRDKWVWYQKKALYDGTGKIYRYLAVLSDISQRKETERELTFSKAAMDQNLTPIYCINKEAEIIYANLAALKTLDYTLEEILTKSVFDIDVFPREKWNELWQNIFSDKVDRIDTFHIRKDGSRIPVEIFASKLNYGNNEFVYAYAVDTTEKIAIEKQIQHNIDFERLSLDISKHFINIPYDKTDAAINKALEEICKFTGTDSAHIYRFSDHQDTITLSHYYTASGSKEYPANLLEIPSSKNSWHYKALSKEKTVTILNTNKLENHDPIKKQCKELGIGSFIDIGLFYQNEAYGFFGLNSKEECRKWTSEEIQLLQLIGDLFMNVIQRRDFMKELLDSELNYREIYNATSEAIFIHNAETGVIEDVNQATLNMFGLSYEQALALPLEELIGFEENQGIPLHMVWKTNDQPQTIEWLSKKATGETFWTEVTLKSAEIHGAKKVIAVVRDISERKNTQQILLENEAKYRMIVEGQSDIIVKLNKQGKIQFASPSFEKVFEKLSYEVIDTKFSDYIKEQDRELIAIAMKKLLRPPHSCFFEFKADTKTGARWLAWNFSSVLTDSVVTDFIGVGRDITYQKMVESALRESEDRFRSIVQNLSDVVFLLDEKANIKYVTPSCEEYLGIAVEELLGNNILNLIHSDDKWLAEENISLHIEGADYSLPYEIRLRHTSNTWKVFEAKSQNMLKHLAVNSIIFTISDITERKLMEKQVLDAIIKTEEKERERFAKDLHDDLGPLLSSIKMYVGMLAKVEDKKKQQFIVENLQDIVKEAITTTKDVSNDLNPHVLNNYGLISALKLFIEKISGEVTIKFIEELGDVRYSAAIELSLYRISKELINNTIKHAQASEIKLRIWEKGGNLNLLYEDNGKGLPETALKAKKASGMGLSNIISRTKSLNAKHNFYTDLPSGFKFEMQVPLVQD
jgi:PAS domain S-box-containing protein